MRYNCFNNRPFVPPGSRGASGGRAADPNMESAAAGFGTADPGRSRFWDDGPDGNDPNNIRDFSTSGNRASRRNRGNDDPGFSGRSPGDPASADPPGGMCARFAQMLGGTLLPSPGHVCTVARPRNLGVTIEGFRTNSPLAIDSLFSYEDPDCNGRTLNLGIVPLRQNEVDPFVGSLRQQGITVAGIQSDWLFESPQLISVTFQSVEPPLDFAAKVINAIDAVMREAPRDPC